MFFLPDDKAEEIENFVGYCLAHAANRFQIQVHACVMMSNHLHVDATDPCGNLVGFKQLFNSMLARGINVLRGRFDGVWSHDRPCDTRRSTDEETLTDLVYTLTNPVKDGLVKRGGQWKGFTTYGWRFGESRRFKRPSFLFDEDGDMPTHATLTLCRPPIFSRMSDDDLYETLMLSVRSREKQFRDQMKLENRRIMGVEKVRRQRWNAAPRSFQERFTRAPRVAVTNKWLRLAELNRDREWERMYAIARADLLDGRDAVFPIGTYWLRRYAGVTVGERAPP